MRRIHIYRMLGVMQQLPLDFSFTRIGRCEACAERGVLNARICRGCETRHGRRIAELLARARTEPGFARRCFERLAAPERLEFVRTLGTEALAGVRPGLRKCAAKVPALRVVGCR